MPRSRSSSNCTKTKCRAQRVAYPSIHPALGPLAAVNQARGARSGHPRERRPGLIARGRVPVRCPRPARDLLPELHRPLPLLGHGGAGRPGLERLGRRTNCRGEAPSLRWILFHLVEEYRRHNGQADLLRESVDGLTGSSRRADSPIFTSLGVTVPHNGRPPRGSGASAPRLSPILETRSSAASGRADERSFLGGW
jgi:hypothetical protein